MKHFLLIAIDALIGDFFSPWQPLLEKQIPSSILCSLLIYTIPGKMELKR